jgi:hypothetical protein
MIWNYWTWFGDGLDSFHLWKHKHLEFGQRGLISIWLEHQQYHGHLDSKQLGVTQELAPIYPSSCYTDDSHVSRACSLLKWFVPCQKPHLSRCVVAKGSYFSRVCSLTKAFFFIHGHSCEFEKSESSCFKLLESCFPLSNCNHICTTRTSFPSTEIPPVECS